MIGSLSPQVSPWLPEQLINQLPMLIFRRKEAHERRDVFYTAVMEAHAPGEHKTRC
ncbi:MAG TPA: hypothetical protein VK138_05660 [Acidiferrobacterales bacterium]|nr:hypothetical protein [Acidiferrobacterales bacterium]